MSSTAALRTINRGKGARWQFRRPLQKSAGNTCRHSAQKFAAPFCAHLRSATCVAASSDKLVGTDDGKDCRKQPPKLQPSVSQEAHRLGAA